MTAELQLTRERFAHVLHVAAGELQARLPRLKALEGERTVIVYSYGAKGKELALLLGSKNTECLIFDNSETSRARARLDGFSLTDRIDLDLPLVVAAGQNQIEILSSLGRDAYSLAEALYAYDLPAAFGPARDFAQAILDDSDALFDVYRRLDERSAATFLEVLDYRLSLDPRRLVSRRPVGEMWRPPVDGLDIRSFCDVGAYDGDSLAATKATYPALTRSFTIEPNPDMAPAIAAVAERLGVTNTNFVGAAWSHDTNLSAWTMFNAMLVIEESEAGEIHAKSLDKLLAGESFDLIKMDVEGTERAVLAGGVETLSRAKCIAFAGYHLPHDLFHLPCQLGEILGAPLGTENPEGWRLAFAHYSQVFDDSIFYAWRDSNGV